MRRMRSKPVAARRCVTRSGDAPVEQWLASDGPDPVSNTSMKQRRDDDAWQNENSDDADVRLTNC
jgi:hypothetical protein